jgi:Bacterial Ig domain/FG-GAP-like repeat
MMSLRARLTVSALVWMTWMMPAAAGAQVVVGPGEGAEPVVRLVPANGSPTDFFAYNQAFRGGVRAALGDVNGDGTLDIITAAGPGGGPHVRVFNGTNLAELASFYAYTPTFTGGVFVAAGDVDGDGRADIITGAGAGGGPHVRVFSGADLSELASFYAYTPGFSGGVSVAAGDVDGDGRADIITGAGPGGGPHVRVFRGGDLAELATLYAYSAAFDGGVSVAAADVNGDGLSDIITGAGPGGGPHVRVFDAADLSDLSSFYAYDPAFRGGVSVAAVDFDGNGDAEIVTGAGPGGSPHVRVFRASDLTELASFYAFDPSFSGGVFLGSVAGGSGLLRFTSADNASFAPGVAGSFSITTEGGSGSITLTATGALPSGVTFTDNGDGTATLAGTPDPGTGGTYPLTFTGVAGVAPPVTQAFTLTVEQAPTITSANTATFNVTIAGSFTVTTTGAPPPTITASGALPTGVTFTDNGNGTATLAGTPATGTGGSYPLTITAANGINPPAAQNFTLIVLSSLPPTLDPIADPAAIPEDSGQQTVNLTGITAGPAETQPLQVTAVSDTLALIPNPTVTYTSPNTTGSLAYTPVADASGTAIVTVTITDGGADGNLGTAGDNATFSRQFTVTVTTVNDSPTLNAIPDPAPILEDAGQQTVNLSGIAAGGGETQPLQVTATSDTPSLIPNPTVTYVSPGTAGSLTYTPLPNVSGTAIVTVVVTDGGLDNNLGTSGDNGTTTRTFTVAVTAVNDLPTLDPIADPAAINEEAGLQTVNLAGISAGGGESQALAVTATSNNTGLIPNPTVTYTSPNATGSLTYTPVANASGTAVITVRVTDAGTAFVERTFTVIVNAVNDAPSFMVGTNQTVVENAGPQTVAGWATAINPGPGESAQVLTFVIAGNTNTALFSAGPAVASDGTLTYTSTLGVSGTATITLELHDDGGTANGGVDTSGQQTFTITVTDVNDPPTLDSIPDPAAILEDAGLQTVNLSGISAGPGESAQPLQVTASSNNTAVIPNPTVSYTSPNATGSLTYTPVANGAGSAIITVTVTDGGPDNNLGTTGDNGTVTRTFTVVVTAVNDAPAITAGATLAYTEGQVAQAIDTTITVTDVDNTNLAFATVQITGNYVNGQDVLEFTPAFGISRIFVPATGTLTLSGSNLVANYQAALRSVTYVNTSSNPSTAPRTVTWSVNDGAAASNLATSTITVTAVNSSPNGVADAWTTFGNTDLVVDQAGPATPFVADTTPSTFGVLDNDTDPEGDPRVVTGIVGCGDTTAPFTCATTAGGSVTMESNGRFTYRPQAGDTGADTFQYVLTDVPSAGVPGSVNVTVNLTLQERIWYVDGNVAGPGTGTSSDPFSALPATAGDADDYIFVHDSTVTGSITLLNGQKLYGEGFGLSINQSLNGNPAPVVLVAPGNSPAINATSGNAVGVLANTANGSLTNIEIRGLTLSTSAASSNAIDVTSANAANVGVTISGVVVNGATAEGIDINQGSTGTATVSLSNLTVTSTGTGIDLNETAGAMTVTGFSGLTITGDTVGSGIVVTNATFDATAGVPFNQVTGGVTAVGESTNPVGGAGVVLTNVSGDLAFTDLDIFTAAGAGLQVSGTGALNAGAGTGTGVSVTAGAATMLSAGGPVVDIASATVDLQLGSATVTSSATTGISLNAVSGTVSSTLGSIASTSGSSVVVTGGTVSLSYGGTITQASNAAMVSVSGHTTGTIGFGGSLNATTGTGLQFTDADSTYNFTGTTTLNGGDAGIDITGGSSGTFSFGTNTSIANPSGTAFFLSGSNATVTYGGNITDNSGFAVDIDNHDSGVVTFATGSITSNGTGTGIRVANSNGGAVNFNSPTIALTTTTNTAVTLDTNNAGGTVNFNPAGGGNGLDISTTSGTGFSALGGGTLTVQGAGNTITTTAATALHIDSTAIGVGGVTFASTTSAGATTAVILDNVTPAANTVALGAGSLAGTFRVGDGAGTANTGGTAPITYAGTIATSGTTRAVDIQDRASGAGNITLSGTITHGATGNTNVIFLDDNAAGTITFSGANSVLNGGTSTAVSLTDNTGATVSFAGGGLDIDTTSGTGFLATGGGTVTVQGTGNTILANGSGTALHIANTTIGANDVTFQSISAGTGAGTAGTGIFVDTTGALGGLHVTGTGSAGSGGTIRNKTGADGSTAGTGIYLNSTTDVQLAWMQLNDFDNYGIRGSQVTGFRLTNSIINGLNGNNVATPFNDGSLSFIGTPSTGFGLSGSVAILDNEITGGRQRNVSIDNATGTMNINFLRNFVHHTQASPNGDDGFAIEVDTSAVMFANISNNTFTAHGGDHFNLSLINNANADLTFANNDLNGGFAGALGQGLFILGASYNGTFKYDITGNDVQGNVQGGAIFVNKGSGTGTFSGRIQNNVVGNAGVTGSGSAQAVGIHASARGAGGSHTTLIDNNQVFQYFDRGIVLEAGEGSPTLVATVTGNTVSNFADAINSLHGIHFDFGILGTDNAQITVDVRNNLIANAGNEPQGGVDFRMRTAGLNDTFIAGYSGGNSSANAQAFIDAANTAGTSFSVTQAASGTYNNGPAVPLAPPNLPTLPPSP